MSENVFNYEQALKKIDADSQGFDVNAHADETIGPVDVKQVMETTGLASQADSNTVHGTIPDVNTPEGRAENEKRIGDARDRESYENQQKQRRLEAELNKIKEANKPKELLVDKGDHYEVNFTPTQADWIGAGVAATTGGLLISATAGNPLGIAAGTSLGTYAGHKTREALTHPVQLPKPKLNTDPDEHPFD